MGDNRLKRTLVVPIVLGSLALGQATFSDVPAGHWANQAVQRLVELGLITGFPDSSFRGEQGLSRYEAAQLIYRAWMQLEASPVSPEDLQVLNQAILELQNELQLLGMQLEQVVSQEELANIQQAVVALQAQQGSLLEQTTLTANQSLLQSSKALWLLEEIQKDLLGLERELGLLEGRIPPKGKLEALENQLQQLGQALQKLSPGSELPLEQLASLEQRVRALEDRFEKIVKDLQEAQEKRLAEFRARIFEEQAQLRAQQPRTEVHFGLAWRQGFGYALAQEGPNTNQERALGEIWIRRGDFGLGLYSEPGVLAGVLEGKLDSLESRAVWLSHGAYAYRLKLGLGPLHLQGLLASPGVPEYLAEPRNELLIELGLQPLDWLRLELLGRIGREADGTAKSGYLLAMASPCALEGSTWGASVLSDVLFGYKAWLRYSQLEEKTPVGCTLPLHLQRPVLETAIQSSEGILVNTLSYRREGYLASTESFTRNVLEGELGFRWAFGQAQLVPVFGYSRIWFTDVQGSGILWQQTELDHPGKGDRETFRLRLGFSGRFDPLRLEAELLWRNSRYASYTASQYGAKGDLTWQVTPEWKLGLGLGGYVGNNVNLQAYNPEDNPGQDSSLYWGQLNLYWRTLHASYGSDSAGGMRFGVRYSLDW